MSIRLELDLCLACEWDRAALPPIVYSLARNAQPYRRLTDAAEMIDNLFDVHFKLLVFAEHNVQNGVVKFLYQRESKNGWKIE